MSAAPRPLAPPGSVTGALLGAWAYGQALLPSLLPRAVLMQVVLCALAVITGYGIGATAGALARVALPAGRPSATVRRRSRDVAWAVVVLMLAAGVVATWGRMDLQAQQAATIGAGTGAPSPWVVVVGSAVLSFVLLVLGRLLRAGGRRLASLWTRRVPGRAATWLGGLSMAVVLAVVVLGLYAISTVVFGRIDADTAGQTPPSSPTRSGSAASAVAWDSLGREGRTFVSSGPTGAQLAAFAGSAGAPEPIRVFAGLESAPSAQARADLAVQELRRTGGFSRKAVVVITTTGNGFVDPVAADSLEYVMGGDVASAAIQYSTLPSWLSFLVNQSGSEQAGIALSQAVRAAVDELPPASRPKVYVYGESLGAFGSLAAFEGRSPEATSGEVAGGLWVGPPSTSATWGEWDSLADGGTPWQPVVGGGRTLRYADSAGAIDAGAPGWGPSRLLVVQHATDPVVWFAGALAISRPDWLDDPRGPGVPAQARWWPVLFFEQVAMDLAPAGGAPAGAGHNYADSVPVAWVAVLQPAGWTPADTSRLVALVG